MTLVRGGRQQTELLVASDGKSIAKGPVVISRFTSSIHAVSASGAFASICVSIAFVASSKSAAGTTRLTSPIRSASAASIVSPVNNSWSARPLPTSRGRRCVPP